jgi:hypothetical protein
MQPLQLFAHFYADFDHYWQFEMDSRFTGHVGTFLDALSLFARQQPRKQARERASYDYIPRVHGTYSQFSASVNKSLNGGGLWGPDRIKDIKPIGPAPPTARPEDDNFYWGVGEDADLIVLKQCATVSRMQDWVYKDWVGGFQDGNDVPRTACPPAQARASWNLLNAIHKSQAVDALRVPSEATLPSWALWHGLKMILAPQPYYHDPEHDIWEMDEFWNGGPIGSQDDGMAYGLGMYNWTGHGEIVTSTTWVWASEFPSKIMDSWLDDNVGAELPYVMRTHDGHVMAPNLALHPRKTNRNP